MQIEYVRTPVGRARAPGYFERPVGIWLLVLAAMVFVMVLLGGLTRLTGSGLSMVEWQPFTVLPPLSDAAWAETFAKYQATPQYRLVNQGMDLAAFKDIFWLEYVHRLWGRLIGAVFLLPLALFAITGRVGRRQLPRLVLLFLLGGAQGALGWFMVASGLADRPEVSHYRLAAHLLAALAIFGALVWMALDHLDPMEREGRTVRHPLERPLWGLLALVVVTMTAGALVAGLHAGLVYNSFPLMNGAVLPSEAFDLSPVWTNFFENHALVQFDHRLLAILSWLTALSLWWRGRGGEPFRLRGRLALVALAATGQASLGIATLLTSVPVPLAALHQLGAFVLVTSVLWALHAVPRVVRDGASAATVPGDQASSA
ncbi:MAG: heme A synthase [Telmatospirillum sp.]|nr:heme A synthase [Telmatospirillum sp.]